MLTYSFHGFIAREATLRAAATRLPMVRFEKLRFGLCFVPLTDELLAALGPTQPISIEVERLSTGAAEFARDASRRGPVVYVEGEVEGGSGWHAGVAWRENGIVSPPLRLEDRTPVNTVLGHLGIQKEPGKDELSTLQLDEREPA